MISSRHFLAVLTSVAGLAFSGLPAGASAEDSTPSVTHVAVVDHGVTDFSSQGPARMGGGRRGGGGNIGGGGRRGGGSNIGGGRRGGGGNIGRVGRVGHGGRVGRIGVHRVGRHGYVGRVGWRYGRVGRIGYRPWPRPIPVPVPIPMGPGPVRAVAPTCPVCPVQACLIAIYSEPNLTGNTTETRDNQPRLDTSGWQNQITSVIIKGGTWDFFPDLEYRGGPPLRLVPGSYPVLEPQWTKRIGSFMCVR